MEQKLQQFIEECNNQYPQAVSCRFISQNGVESINDKKLLSCAKELSLQMKRINFQPGDRAVLLGANSLHWLICYFAVLYADGVVVTLDTELLPDDTCSLARKMDPAIIFCSEHQIGKIKPLDGSGTVILMLQEFENMMAACKNLPEIKRKDTFTNKDYNDRVAAIVNSSGTGGRLKGILLTHQNIIDAVIFYKNEFASMGIESILCVLPCYAIYPCVVWLAALASGIPIYFADAKKMGLLAILQQQAIQSMPLVPLAITDIHNKIMQNVTKKGGVQRFVFASLTKCSRLLRRYCHIDMGKVFFPAIHKALGSQLRLIMTGGAPLNSQVTKDFYAWGFTIKEGYGLTETAGVISATDGEYNSIGSCGKAVKGITITIDQPDKEGCGEVLISGSRLMTGYFRDPEANESAFVGGVFRTGDLGRIDEKGVLYIVGRSKEIILHSDERKTLPHDVEIRYQDLDGIEKLAVVGITDNITQCDMIHAAIVPTEQLRQEYEGNLVEIKKHIEKVIFQRAAKLPPYLQIVHVNIFDSLPTNALGKIKRTDIKVQIAKEKI